MTISKKLSRQTLEPAPTNNRLIATPYDITDEFIVDSLKYPIRVHCPIKYGEEYCGKVVHYAEVAWEKEVDGLGFYPPPSDKGYSGNDNYDIFVVEHSFVGGFMTPIAVASGFDWLCMSSYITISPKITSDMGIAGLVAHEFNHSCEFAIDPIEFAIIESTAEFIGTMVTYGSLSYSSEVWTFQDYPHKSVDYIFLNTEMSDPEYDYHYGGALFLGFLDEFYGSGDQIFIRKMWENSRQVDYVNEPDYMDTLNQMLPEIKDHTLTDAYREFAKWRWFMNSNDDGAHFKGGDKYNAKSMVYIEKTVAASDLPLVKFEPVNPPQEYGSNYIEFDLKGADGGLLLGFQGDTEKFWSADMILTRGDGIPTEYREVVDWGDFRGILLVPGIGSYDKVVLVISNLTDGEHDPDKFDWEPSNYTLNAELLTRPKASILMDKEEYVTGDSLEARTLMVNPGEEVTLDLVIALQIGDNFYFYPDFTKQFAKVSATLAAESGKIGDFLHINRIGEGLSGEYAFYAAFLDPESGTLMSDISKTSFCINKQQPRAYFTVSPAKGDRSTAFFFDAGGSYDYQDKADALKVRWDWEDDGIWDVSYSGLKKRTHKYSKARIVTIRMEVMDRDGLTDQMTRVIEVAD